jgi:tetratricopeptide (TPR) repeat protein
MKAVRVCPDSLLAAARRGALGPEDRAKLTAHLAICSLCRVMLEAGGDFDRALGERPGDDRIAQRVAERVAADARPHRRRWVVPIVLAAALVTTAAAAAIGANVIDSGATEPAPPREPVERRVVPEQVAPRVEPTDPPIETPIETTEAPVEPAPEPIERRNVRRPAETPVEVEREPPAEAAPRSAAELFALANTRRRERQAAEARALYRELQERYPSSSEALVSRVSLGRMMLASDPGGALAQFDAYLGQRGHSGLREEALFGRASALMRLGRTGEEQRTWRELLERYPGSIYAERARQRLGE